MKGKKNKSFIEAGSILIEAATGPPGGLFGLSRALPVKSIHGESKDAPF